MNSRFLAFVSLLIASFLLAPSLRAQDTDKEVDDAIQQATEVAKKMGVKMPDVKKQLEEVNKEEAKEKAALQKQLEAPGSLALPDWTPKVPQFEPTGPVSRKIVSDEVNIIQTGTSLLTPAELEDSWEEAAKGDKLNSSRTNGSYNDTKVVRIYTIHASGATSVSGIGGKACSRRQNYACHQLLSPAQACGRIEGSARISRHSVGVYFSDACCGRLLSSSIEERTKVRSRRSDAFIRTNGPTYEEENPSPCLSLLERERQNHPAAAAKQIFCRPARKENRHGTCRYAR